MCKKTQLLHIVGISVLVLSLNTLADTDLRIDDFIFHCVDSTKCAALTKYSGSATSVTIPTQVSYKTEEYVLDADGNIKYDDDGNPKTHTVTHRFDVTSIEGAFENNGTIESVTLPSSVIALYSAFANCSSIHSINLGHIEIIGSYAFKNCTSMSSVSIPSAVTIGENAFSGCSALREMKFGESLDQIGAWTFSGCSSEMEYYFTGDVPAVGSKPFGDFIGAHGHYTAGYAAEWKEVIDSATKRWQELIMEEIPAPVLNTPIVSEVDESINLTWSMDYSTDSLRFDIYRAASNDFSCATIIEEDVAERSFKDEEWSQSYAGGETLYYWVVAKEGGYELGRSNDESADTSVLLPPPIAVEVYTSGADIANGSITLSWRFPDERELPEGMTFSVARKVNDGKSSVIELTSTVTSMSYTDTTWGTAGKTATISYWVKPNVDGWPVSDECVTRKRYGLFVGIDKFTNPANNLPNCVNDVLNLRDRFSSDGDCHNNASSLFCEK